MTIECPKGATCALSCTGNSACKGATVVGEGSCGVSQCDGDYACYRLNLACASVTNPSGVVVCKGDHACYEAVGLTCMGQTPGQQCNITCDGYKACKLATFACPNVLGLWQHGGARAGVKQRTVGR